MDYSKDERMKYVVVIDNDQVCRMIISANLSKKYLGIFNFSLTIIPTLIHSFIPSYTSKILYPYKRCME